MRSLKARLNRPELFCVCYLDALETLDITNLRYPDILMALARQLVEVLSSSGVSLGSKTLRPLENWFVERVEKDEKTNEFALEIQLLFEGLAESVVVVNQKHAPWGRHCCCRLRVLNAK